ncbi:MAG: GlsB/YeaQ/YmgE family stress response membrane protein [Dehalococcoidia bacterium]|nr:GlsB/YeaQ/YmgE family stress response membrane protein [Dehalococcoidia bacterium]
MDIAGTLVLLAIVAAVTAGVAYGARGRPTPPLIALTAIGAALGGFGGSEWFTELSSSGPEIDGLNLIPALIGAALIGVLAGLPTLAPGQELRG